jgi:O-antigen/teichoic acid export membrane protein
VLAQGIAVLVVFVLTPLQLLGMGTERYGICGLAAATVSYVTLFDVGGGWAVMRFIPQYKSQGRIQEANEAFSVALLVSLGIGLLGAGILWATATPIAQAFHTTPGLRDEAAEAVRIAGLTLPPILVLDVLSGAGKAMGRFRLWAGISAGSVVVFNVLWLIVARASGSPVEVMWAQVGVSFLALAIWLVVLIGDAKSPKLCFPRHGRLAWELVRFSALSSVSQLGLMLLITVGTICIAFAVGAASIVYYAIPLSFAQRLMTVSSTAATVLFPTISEARGNLRSSYEKLIADTHHLVAITTTALSSVLFWAGPAILAIWISNEFARRATGPIMALAIGFGAVSITFIYLVNLHAVGRVSVSALLSVGSALIGLAAGLLFALRYGETGGAVGIMIGLVLLATTIVAASAYYERSPSGRDIRLTCIVALALSAIGAAAHFTVRGALPPSTERMWVEVLAISLSVGLTAILLGRSLIVAEHPVEKV